MKVITATCKEGRIDVPEGSVADGVTVTVLVPEGEPSFTLSPAESRELQASIDQASRGEVVDGWQLLQELKA